MKKNILIIILSVIVLGFASFTVYDKVIKKDSKVNSKSETKNELKEEEIDVESDLVKNLVYPTLNSESGIPSAFLLKDEKASNYSISQKAEAGFDYDNDLQLNMGLFCKLENGNILVSDTYENGYYDCASIDATKIETGVKTIFGPDTEYKAENVEKLGCGPADYTYYDSSNKLFYFTTAGGGAYPLVSYSSKSYKAIKKGEYLYLYDYAVLIYGAINEDDNRFYIFSNYDKYNQMDNESNVAGSYNTNLLNKYAITSFDYSNNYKVQAQAELNKLISKNEAKTYVWTFKKQSDGKYYFDSGKWES